MRLCNRYKIHLSADEIYALSVYDVSDPKAIKLRSILTLDIERHINPNYLHLLYGMSKEIPGGGLGLGCIYTHNEELLRALSIIRPFHWRSSSSERIAACMLEDGEQMDHFLRSSRLRLEAKSNMARNLLNEAGIGYYAGTNLGFFLWIDMRLLLKKEDGYGWAAEDALTERFIRNAVYLTKGKEVCAEQPRWYQLIFTQEEGAVREGIKRIIEVVKSRQT